MATKKNLKEEYEKLGEELKELKQAIYEADDEAEAKKAFTDKLKEYKKITKKYMDEKVTIRLFKDNDKYSDDVFVGWNDRTFMIKRGVNVEVPRGVAEIIRRSEEQKQAASIYMQELQDEYEAESKKRGLN